MTLKIKGTDLIEGVNDKDEVIVDSNSIHHLFEKKDLMAVWAAYHAGRPLLLRGKTGTGKSQFAKAIAHQLSWAFVPEVLHGGKELDDLHWQYDAINRLGEAQSLGYQHRISGENSDEIDVKKLLAPENFMHPGSFWWAFDWKSASGYPANGGETSQSLKPHTPQGWNKETDGVVLLVDEIDKAEPNLPNGLLQTLGDLEFNVPYVNKRISADPERLLIIITTNEERDLPSALVRRCYTHTLKMEEGESRHEWLIKRGELHFKDRIKNSVYKKAAELLWEDRQSHKQYPPGLAEYLDLLRALSKINKTKQNERLEDISQFVYQKEKETDG